MISEPALDSDFKISAGSDEQIIYIAYETEDKDVVAQLLDQSLVLDLEIIVLTYPWGLVVVEWLKHRASLESAGPQNCCD